jgi:hypothetical protein
MTQPFGKNQNYNVQRVHNTNGERREYIQVQQVFETVSYDAIPTSDNNRDDGYDIGSIWIRIAEGTTVYILTEIDSGTGDATWVALN